MTGLILLIGAFFLGFFLGTIVMAVMGAASYEDGHIQGWEDRSSYERANGREGGQGWATRQTGTSN